MQLGAVPSMMPLVSVKEENSSAQLNVSIPRPVAPFCAAAVAAGDSFVESDQESFYEARVERLSRPVRDTSSPQNSEVRQRESFDMCFNAPGVFSLF